MKNILILLISLASSSLVAQIDANSVMGLPTATTVEMTGIVGPAIGASLFNTDDQSIYRYTTTGWQRSTDDQLDSEVNLTTPIDVDEGGVAAPTNETNVQEVINAIAPITSKAARVFYPPSIEIDASSNGTFTVDLYAQYTAQFATPTASSPAAPAAVPVYGATDLYYYVTYADPAVFNTGTMSITADGKLTYTVTNQPVDFNSLINVVFVVK
ncbi:hypothetical protein ACJRPK_14935 [Aquimarina sp. 2-A2]|uniref:hypothetical protein n=1 Tax=Aquimarina sp. 2-A2 TaxID=3382644 RepID=UPI00387F186B